jgi:HEAT repeat protein
MFADLVSGDTERAENAARELPQHGNEVLPILQQLVLDQDADRRWWAIRALSEFATPEVGNLMIAALEDPDGSVRYAAAFALRKQPHIAAIPKLIEALSNKDTLFARLDADALVAIGSPAVEPLIATLDSPAPNARVEAARALALIGDTRAVPALFKLLEAESIVLQHWANEGLEKMGVGMSFFQT